MPHSSGGGSHGGGHHGGSHSSSRSGGGGGGRSLPPVSTTRFPGARRYSYIDRNNQKHYIFCSTDPAKAYKPRWWMIIIYIPFILAMSFVYSDVIRIPRKVDNLDAVIVVEDNAHVLSDTDALKSELLKFYNASGVTPAVITVYHENWQKNYTDLEKYAYDLYVNKFTDEKHWLVVYSIPRTSRPGTFIDWRWEGMIGNDVTCMISYKNEDYFTEQMQKNLLASSRYTVDEAIAVTFSDTLKEASKITFDLESFMMSLAITGFLLLHAAMMIGITPKALKYSKAKYDPDPRDMPVKCNYCQSTFVLADHTNCPNCGGPIELKPDIMEKVKQERLLGAYITKI